MYYTLIVNINITASSECAVPVAVIKRRYALRVAQMKMIQFGMHGRLQNLLIFSLEQRHCLHHARRKSASCSGLGDWPGKGKRFFWPYLLGNNGATGNRGFLFLCRLQEILCQCPVGESQNGGRPEQPERRSIISAKFTVFFRGLNCRNRVTLNCTYETFHQSLLPTRRSCTVDIAHASQTNFDSQSSNRTTSKHFSSTTAG